MSDELKLGKNEEGVARLIFALESHASFALETEKLTPGIRQKFETAQLEMRPTFFILADMISKAEYPEDGFMALWRLISASLTLIDPEENKIGIAAALKSSSQSLSGKASGVARFEKSLEIWRNQALSIAQAYRREHPKSFKTDVARAITGRFVGEGCPEDKMLLKAIAAWEKSGDLPPKKKMIMNRFNA